MGQRKIEWQDTQYAIGQRKKLGTPQSRLAHLLKRTQSAITYVVSRGKVIVEDNSYLIE